MSTTTTTLLQPTFTNLGVKSTASVGGTYIPPLASEATGSYYAQPSSTTSYNNPNPTTPAFLNDYDWINGYLVIHTMSNASYRYAYILWLLVALVVVVFGFLHLSGRRGGALGARWAKWALRRRTWRKKSTLAAIKRSNKTHKQPWSLPSNAQILSLVFLFVVPAILCTVGPDYIAPGTAVWDLKHNLTRRHLSDVDWDMHLQGMEMDLLKRVPIASTATTRPPDFTIQKTWWTAGGRTGIIAFALFPLVVLFSLKKPPFALLAIPYTIQIHFDKLARLHRWLGRLIWLICAVHVGTWSVQLYRDTRHGHPGRAWSFVWVYHKFVYGMIAFIALTLLTLLSIGPIRKRFYEVFYISHLLLVPTTLVFSALHFPPIWWWCWAPLFLWIAERSYRMAHFLYLNGILHGGSQKTVSSFVYPGEEMVVEEEKVGVVTSGGYASVRPYEASTPVPRRHVRGGGGEGGKGESWEMKSLDGNSASGSGSGSTFFQQQHGRYNSDPLDDHPNFTPTDGDGEWSPGTAVDYRTSADGHFPFNKPTANSSRPSSSHVPLVGRPKSITHLNFPAMHPLTSILAPPSSCISKLPPPGYAKAILLPGRTIRLSLITARRFTWSPGQHILLTIPSISRFTSHPFTIASVSDSAIAGAHGREMVLVVRAKRGFTKKLWEKVKREVTVKARGEKKDEDLESGGAGGAGVVFRAWVDGPFGSSVRAHWGSHSSVVIVCGGSGVSFGTAILEYLCLCLSGRDGRSLGGKSGGVGKDGFVTRRVRFVWIVREYSHLQWCAPIIRRCMDMMPNKNVLQVDIFVTNFNDVPSSSSNKSGGYATSLDLHTTSYSDPLEPPAPRFAREGKLERRGSVSSDDSDASNISSSSFAELRYADGGQSTHSHGDEDYHVLDLTNFDDDDDTHAPGEMQLSLKLKKESRLRRAASRKATNAVAAKRELDARAGGGGVRVVPKAGSGGSPTKSTKWDEAREMGMGMGMTMSPSMRAGDLGMQGSAQDILLATPKWGPGSSTPRATTPRAEDQTHQHHLPHSFSRPNSGWAESASPSARPLSSGTEYTQSESLRHLIHDSSAPTIVDVGDDVLLEFDDDEMDDLNAVCAVARPGKPKLDKILRDEVERSRGAVAVACCGPTSLNALTRKLVASLIDPERIRRGDLRGQITLTSEEFEW